MLATYSVEAPYRYCGRRPRCGMVVHPGVPPLSHLGRGLHSQRFCNSDRGEETRSDFAQPSARTGRRLLKVAIEVGSERYRRYPVSTARSLGCPRVRVFSRKVWSWVSIANINELLCLYILLPLLTLGSPSMRAGRC